MENEEKANGFVKELTEEELGKISGGGSIAHCSTYVCSKCGTKYLKEPWPEPEGSPCKIEGCDGVLKKA